MIDSDIQRRLEILRANLERLAEIPQGTFEDFSTDFRNLDSALHRLQTSIQALLDLGAVLVSRLGGTPGSPSFLLRCRHFAPRADRPRRANARALA